jgi:hypothetical protein
MATHKVILGLVLTGVLVGGCPEGTELSDDSSLLGPTALDSAAVVGMVYCSGAIAVAEDDDLAV